MTPVAVCLLQRQPRTGRTSPPLLLRGTPSGPLTLRRIAHGQLGLPIHGAGKCRSPMASLALPLLAGARPLQGWIQRPKCLPGCLLLILVLPACRPSNLLSHGGSPSPAYPDLSCHLTPMDLWTPDSPRPASLSPGNFSPQEEGAPKSQILTSLKTAKGRVRKTERIPAPLSISLTARSPLQGVKLPPLVRSAKLLT